MDQELFSGDYLLENAFCLKFKGTTEMFREGATPIPVEGDAFFGVEKGGETRVVLIFEGREYPCYIESKNGGAYTLMWSRPLHNKFIFLFPDYETFYDEDPKWRGDDPVLSFEKLGEGVFNLRLSLPNGAGSATKQDFFDHLGPENTTANFTSVYEILFLLSFFESVDHRWRAEVKKVAAHFMVLLKKRQDEGKSLPPGLPDDLLTGGADEVLAYFLAGPYQELSAADFLLMENEGEDFEFALNPIMVDEMTSDDKRLLVEMLEGKAEAYFGHLDGPSFYANLSNFLHQYADFFTKDFRYSHKDLITIDIPGTLELLPFFDAVQYKPVGYAGRIIWAEVPWVQILDREITRTPDTEVYIGYYLNKSTPTLYLTLCEGKKKSVDRDKLARLVPTGGFVAGNEEVELNDEFDKSRILCYQAYVGDLPGEAQTIEDLQRMLALYQTYKERIILGIAPPPEEEIIAEVASEMTEGEGSEAKAAEQMTAAEGDEGSPSPEESVADGTADDEVPVMVADEQSADLGETIAPAADAASADIGQDISEEPTVTPEVKAVVSEAAAATPEVAADTAKAAIPVPEVPTPAATPAMTEIVAAVREQSGVDAAELAALKEQIAGLTAAIIAEREAAAEDAESNPEPEPAAEPEPVRRHFVAAAENLTNPTDVRGTLARLSAYITAQGGGARAGLVENLYLALKANPFVILTGAAGVGKVTLIRLLAEALGATTENGRYKQVSIQAGWQGPGGLLGAVNDTGAFVPGALNDYLEAALAHPGMPFILCLDEMNAAPADSYFAEFLAVMENRREVAGALITDPLMGRYYFGLDDAAYERYGGLYLPDNLYIFGTISDESAAAGVSPKLVDRAAVIAVGHPSLGFGSRQGSGAEGLANDFLVARRPDFTIPSKTNAMITEMVALLEAINEILLKCGAQIGLGVRDDICTYLAVNAELQLMSQEAALDNAICQEIIPRIQGADARVEEVLIDLYKICAGTREEDAIRSEITAGRGLFPDSAAKLRAMMAAYDRSGRTNFWLN